MGQAGLGVSGLAARGLIDRGHVKRGPSAVLPMALSHDAAIRRRIPSTRLRVIVTIELDFFEFVSNGH